MAGKVVVSDSRSHRDAHAATYEVGRLLVDPAKPDVRLLLVLDAPGALTRHALAYEELWRSRQVERLLVVVVGPLEVPGSLDIPGSIGAGRDSGIIWVGDTGGVDWGLTHSAIVSVHSSGRVAAGLDALLGILKRPEVFTRTLDLIAGIPEQVISPGLRIFEVTANQTTFLAALGKCIGRILNPDAADARDEQALVDAAIWRPGTVRSTLVPGGRLASARDRCIAEAAELAETAEALATTTALYGTEPVGDRAQALAVSTGAELRSYRTAVQVLVGTPAGERAARLRDWGIRPAEGREAEPDDAAAAIAARVEAGHRYRSSHGACVTTSANSEHAATSRSPMRSSSCARAPSRTDSLRRR